jgi:hypothetical protein
MLYKIVKAVRHCGHLLVGDVLDHESWQELVVQDRIVVGGFFFWIRVLGGLGLGRRC